MKFFLLEVPDAKGDSKRKHLERVAPFLEEEPKELVGAKFPEGLGYLLELFTDFSRGRQRPLAPATWAELRAWITTRGLRLLPFELSVIKTIDEAFVEVFAAAAKESPCPSK